MTSTITITITIICVGIMQLENATLVPYTTLHSYGTTHSKEHRSKWVQQNGSPARTITVALDMSQTFNTINMHTLIRKLLHTKISGTIIKFIANYIKRRKAYTTYRNYTSSQRQFKTGVPQGGVLAATLYNMYTTDIPPSRALAQVMAYADDITNHIYTHKHECSQEMHATIPT